MKKLLFTASIFLAFFSNGQTGLFIEGGAGITNKYLSGELQGGVRSGKTTLLVGFISLPDSKQPALFNLRIGRTVNETWLIYAGYVRVMRSSDNKQENGNSWQVGTQYHFAHYDRGTFYIGGNYTANNYFSVHIGMSGFLMNKHD